MDTFVDLTCVDWPKREERFDVVLMLRSSKTGKRVRLKARVPESDPTIASVTGLWLGANWFEREAFDMFGVRFVGHPDLRRILMYEEFEGHPLRKDYDASKQQPLVPYRPEALDRLPPFGKEEGMPWERPKRPGREHTRG
jgi:NADH-quinone oxidoreductase subunit C